MADKYIYISDPRFKKTKTVSWEMEIWWLQWNIFSKYHGQEKVEMSWVCESNFMGY